MIVSFLAFAFLLLMILALVLLWPSFNRSWAWSVASHALSLITAIGLGWFAANVEGFGFAVGDPPYGTGEKKFDFGAIWLSTTLYVLAALYAVRVSLWLVARMVNGLRGYF